MAQMSSKQLFDLLVQAELQQYYMQFVSSLNISTVSQLRTCNDEDLAEIGMTKPEIRRLKKYLKKCSQPGALNKLKKILNKGLEESGSSSSDVQARSPSIPQGQYLINETEITLQQEIGCGEFGTVHRGIWKSSSKSSKIQVALKCVKKSTIKAFNAVQFLSAVSQMHRFDHKHIVQLYGVVTACETVTLVSELLPMKSLLSCLKDPIMRPNLTIFCLCDFAQQIADGMAYLECRHYVHQDLAARNVLVYSKDLVKICDYGLTRALGVDISYYKTNVSLKLPIAWCAPECIEKGVFSSASDVWAYAITLWEMFSYGFQPWAGLTGSQIASTLVGKDQQLLDQPDRCPRDFYSLMTDCWRHQPESRPTFAQIQVRLNLVKPERLQSCKDTHDRIDCLPCKQYDVITVLDHRPNTVPFMPAWKGVHEVSGKVGYFDPSTTMPYVDPKQSILRRHKVSRAVSERKSSRSSVKLNAGMISGPLNDVRHTGHIGCDGTMFGDVSFVEQSRDSMVPLRTSSHWPEKNLDDMRCSTVSLPVVTNCDTISSSRSNISVISYDSSCVTSLISSDTLTDVSSLPGDIDSLPKSNSDERMDANFMNNEYDDVEASTDCLADFKIADISNTFDLGPSLIDEVMKALGGPKDPSKDPALKAKVAKKPSNELSLSDLTSGVSRSPVKRFDPTEAVCDSNGLNKNHDQSNNVGITRPNNNGLQSAHQEMSTSENLNFQTPLQSCTSTNQRHNILQNSDSESDVPTPKILDFGESRVFPSRLSNSKERPRYTPIEKSAMSSNGIVTSENRDSSSTNSDNRNFNLASSETRYSVPANAENRIFVEKPSMLSRIGSALGSKRGDNHHQNSTFAQSSPASSSSSSEFLPSVPRKLSSASFSSLPGQTSSLPGQAKAARPDNFNVSTLDADTNPMRRIRDGRSFSKTKAKIRSSVASVIGGVSRNSSKGSQPLQTNFNANSQFFDRLREQELENAQREAEMSSSGNVDAKFSPNGVVSVPEEDEISRSYSENENQTRTEDRMQLSSEGRLDIQPNDVLLAPRKTSNGPSQQTDLPDAQKSRHHSRHGAASKPPRDNRGGKTRPERRRVDSSSRSPSVSRQAQTAAGKQTSSKIDSDSNCSSLSFLSQDSFDNSNSVQSFAVDSNASPSLQPAVPLFEHSSSPLSDVCHGHEPSESRTPRDDRSRVSRHDETSNRNFDSDNGSPIRISNVDNRNHQEEYQAANETQNSDSRTIESKLFNKKVKQLKIHVSGATTEDCIYALTDANFDVDKAVQLLKLRQLVCLELASEDECRRTLALCQWDLDAATNYLIANPPDQESPDLVLV